jgi:hypothetical protein
MSKWRNIIKIKDYFTNNDSDDSVLQVTKVLIPQLERILKFEQKWLDGNKVNALDEDLIYEFEEVIDDFKFVKEAIENNDDPEEYSFESWCDAFNEYLTMLYDLGDTIIGGKDFFSQEKFLWIE